MRILIVRRSMGCFVSPLVPIYEKRFQEVLHGAKRLSNKKASESIAKCILIA